ncbi:MAG: response regulator transcription factor [Rhodocyclaceae bacterium]|jgi:DNA-binding NarL/FixJ family response regulator|nr:response regulator transcription factor [Rhodocyclaceae bacterium]
MNVLIVDDHPLIRDGLKRSLEHEADIRRIDEAGTAAAAVSRLQCGDYDAVILDVNLPDGNGLEIIRSLREINPVLPVLILSLHAEENLALRAIQAGADGYLRKDCTAAEVLAALRQLVRGKKYFSPGVMAKLVRMIGSPRDIDTPHDRLSDREYQVMLHIAHGLPLTAIAALLDLSPNTISTYRTRIFEKLGIDNNAALTRYALERQLID